MSAVNGMVTAQLDPKILAALDAVETEEVQDLIRRVSAFGLAVCLPHMHDEGGAFLPLPDDVIQYESAQEVTFVKRDDPVNEGSIPVAWRFNETMQVVASCAHCDKYRH